MEKVFDLRVKKMKKKLRRKIIETSRNNDYTTGDLLDFAYLKENYRFIAIDLSNQIKLKDLQQVSFIGRLENQGNEANALFIIDKSEKTTSEFLQNSVNIL